MEINTWSRVLHRWRSILDPKIHKIKVLALDMKTLELDSDTLNTDRLIWISAVATFDFYLSWCFFPLSMDIPSGYWKMRVLSLNGAQNFKFPGFWLAALGICIHHSDGIPHLRKFPVKTRDLNILKINKTALISISTIQKFSAQVIL